MDNGMISFSEIMKRWAYNFSLLPMNDDGVLQMKLIAADNSRRDIAERFGDINNVPVKLGCFDAVSEGSAYIIAMDMNITRVTQALQQASVVDITPNIVCLPHQKKLYQYAAVKMQYSKLIKFTIVNKERLFEDFPSFSPTEISLIPARTKKGEYLII